jgi:succinyl-diaminopimelate desuccinylase
MNNNIEKEIINISKRLISFRSSELRPLEIVACLDYIEKYFISLNENVFIKKVVNKECLAIVISNTESNRPDILLNGHIDVVEGEAEQFKPTISNNKLYGRGAIDMKSSVAVMMLSMKEIIEQKINIKATLMIVGDEEVQTSRSTKYLIRKLRLKPQFTIVGEETSFDIVTEQKGSLNLEIEAKGIKTHSAYPERGINAIDKCFEAYQTIKSLSCFKRQIGYRNTIALTYISGGQTINSVPDSCRMGINIRFITAEDLKKIKKLIQNLKIQNFLKINTYCSGSIMKSSDCRKYIMELKKITKEICWIVPETKKTATGSDARYFSSKKLPVIMFGPRGAGYHEKKEYVEIDSLTNYYKILNKFIKNL